MPREHAIRAALRPFAIATAEDPRARVIEEFWTPASHERADLAVVGDLLHGYEIKSAADTLRRLPRQAAAFGRVFDRCTAVIAAKHESRANELLPTWWGLVLVEPGHKLTFRVQRSAQPNQGVDATLIVRLLWRDEASQILSGLGVQPDVRGGRSAMWTQLLESLPAKAVREEVRKALRTRERWHNQRGQPRLSPAFVPES